MSAILALLLALAQAVPAAAGILGKIIDWIRAQQAAQAAADLQQRKKDKDAAVDQAIDVVPAAGGPGGLSVAPPGAEQLGAPNVAPGLPGGSDSGPRVVPGCPQNDQPTRI